MKLGVIFKMQIGSFKKLDLSLSACKQVVTKQLQGTEDHQQNLIDSPSFQFTNEESSFVSHLTQLAAETYGTHYYLLYSNDINTLRDWLYNCFQGNILPFEMIQKLQWSNNIALTESGIMFLSMEGLTYYENAVLVQNNIDKVASFLWVVTTDFTDVKVFFNEFLEFGRHHPDYAGVSNILPVLQQIPVSKAPKSDAYDIVYSSPWAPHVEIEEKHRQITRAIKRWARSSSTHDSIDKYQSILLSIIILLSCEDDLDLSKEQKEKIHQLQMKYILMYQRYLKAAYPQEANAKFVGGLMLLHHTKELCEMNSLRLPI
jgi:hypothetical protein